MSSALFVPEVEKQTYIYALCFSSTPSRDSSEAHIYTMFQFAADEACHIFQRARQIRHQCALRARCVTTSSTHFLIISIGFASVTCGIFQLIVGVERNLDK